MRRPARSSIVLKSPEDGLIHCVLPSELCARAATSIFDRAESRDFSSRNMRGIAPILVVLPAASSSSRIYLIRASNDVTENRPGSHPSQYWTDRRTAARVEPPYHVIISDVGMGASVTSSTSKWAPWKLTVPFDHACRQISIVSMKIGSRSAASNPAPPSSFGFDPMPNPAWIRRPPPKKLSVPKH